MAEATVKTGVWTKDMIEYGSKYISGITLDVGAGGAKYTDFYRAHAAKYVTSDMMAAPHIDHVEDAHAMSFADNSFDTVVSNQMIEHVFRPWEVAREMIRVVKPGGHVVITAPFTAGEHRDPNDLFRYTAQGLSSLFEGDDTEVIECIKCGGMFSIFGGMIKFGFAHPYKKPSRLRVRVAAVLQRLMKKLDTFSPAADTLYGGVFLVVRKKS